jgi:hypothetical protein
MDWKVYKLIESKFHFIVARSDMEAVRWFYGFPEDHPIIPTNRPLQQGDFEVFEVPMDEEIAGQTAAMWLKQNFKEPILILSY